MTPICSEHAALLKRIAKNLNDRTARGVYADWLQERGEPAWYVVANYPATLWFQEVQWPESRPLKTKWGTYSTFTGYQLPWLEGSVAITAVNYLSRTKRILTAYAEGKAK